MMATRTAEPAGPPRTRPARGDRATPPRRQWPWVLAVALLLALLGGAAYVAYRTPVLGLHSVAVSTTSGAVGDEVRSEVLAAAGVATDTPLITIDLAAVRRRVLGVPQVASASVSRHWPNELSITVTERTAVALTKANGGLWLLDATGAPYLEVSGAAPAGLLTIDLATPGVGDPATVAGLAVVTELKAPIRDQVASVSAPSPYRVVVTLRDGRVIVWGSADQGAKKMQILPALLAQPGHTFDISDPDIATVN